MLIIQRKLDQSIMIGDDIEITVVKTGDNSIKLGINAPKDIRIKRSEDIQQTLSELENILNKQTK